jgi:PAS domain-containing protein
MGQTGHAEGAGKGRRPARGAGLLRLGPEGSLGNPPALLRGIPETGLSGEGSQPRFCRYLRVYMCQTALGGRRGSSGAVGETPRERRPHLRSWSGKRLRRARVHAAPSLRCPATRGRILHRPQTGLRAAKKPRLSRVRRKLWTVDVQEMLAALQQQQEALERLAQEQEAGAAKFDVDEHMRVAEAVQDPLERSRAILDVLQTQARVIDSQAINLAMRRILELERSVITLAGRLHRVEQALNR